MLRLTRLLSRKPPGFTNKLKSQPDNQTTDSAKTNKPEENLDPLKDFQNIVNNLQEKLKGNAKHTDSTDSTKNSTTEEKDVKSIFGEKFGTKRKTVTKDGKGNTSYEYHYEMDGNKTVGRIGQVIGFLFGFWLFKDYLPISGSSSNSSNNSSPYTDQSKKDPTNLYEAQAQQQARKHELQYKSVNEMYDQRQLEMREKQMQAEINAYNEQDDRGGFKNWDNLDSNRGNSNHSEGFSSYNSSKFDK